MQLFVSSRTPNKINGRQTVGNMQQRCAISGWFVLCCSDSDSGELSCVSRFRALFRIEQKSATMKRQNHFTADRNLLSGALYLFHGSDMSCPASNSLFGIIDKTSDGIVYLESSSRDLRRFRLWYRLPNYYRYHRQASRSELRDYIFDLACYEYRMRSEPSCGRSSVLGDEIGHPPKRFPFK